MGKELEGLRRTVILVATGATISYSSQEILASPPNPEERDIDSGQILDIGIPQDPLEKVGIVIQEDPVSPERQDTAKPIDVPIFQLNSETKARVQEALLKAILSPEEWDQLINDVGMPQEWNSEALRVNRGFIAQENGLDEEIVNPQLEVLTLPDGSSWVSLSYRITDNTVNNEGLEIPQNSLGIITQNPQTRELEPIVFKDSDGDGPEQWVTIPFLVEGTPVGRIVRFLDNGGGKLIPDAVAVFLPDSTIAMYPAEMFPGLEALRIPDDTSAEKLVENIRLTSFNPDGERSEVAEASFEITSVEAKAKADPGAELSETGIRLKTLPDPQSPDSEFRIYNNSEIKIIGRSQDLKYFLISNKRGQELGWISARNINFETQEQYWRSFDVPIHIISQDGKESVVVKDREILFPKFDEKTENVSYINQGGNTIMVIERSDGSKQEIPVNKLPYEIDYVTRSHVSVDDSTRERYKCIFVGLVDEINIQGIESYIFAVDMLGGPYAGRHYLVMGKYFILAYSPYNPNSLGSSLEMKDPEALMTVVQHGDEIIVERILSFNEQWLDEDRKKLEARGIYISPRMDQLGKLILLDIHGQLSDQLMVPLTIYGFRR